MVDFENLFTRAYLKRGPAKSAEPVVDWKQSCLEQVLRYIKDTYPDAKSAFAGKLHLIKEI